MLAWVVVIAVFVAVILSAVRENGRRSRSRDVSFPGDAGSGDGGHHHHHHDGGGGGHHGGFGDGGGGHHG